jgi:RNA polymerase sigma-70 factor, ECF subfamily
VTEQANPKTTGSAIAGAEAIAATIARIQAGETALFHDLIRPVERAVFVMLMTLLRSETDAEDAAQEAFIKVFRHLGSFRGDAKFSTWVLSIARNEGLAWLRKQKTRHEEPLEPATDEERSEISPALLTDWREIPLEALERKELGQSLCRAIMNLPPIYREVVQLRDIDELDVQETAAMLGITAGSVKVRLHRARIMLQKDLVAVMKAFAPRNTSWNGRLFGRGV